MRAPSVALSIALLAFSSSALGQPDTINLNHSKEKPQIDGVIGPDEWKNAGSVLIEIQDDWKISVFYEHDRENLYFAFENMAIEEQAPLVAEVLFDLDVNDDTEWDSRTHWFHASYSDCQDIGEFFDWETCKLTHPDWEANNLPYADGNDNIEFRIPLSKLNLEPGKGTRIRIAFNAADNKDNISYWPSSAVIADPSTWGYVVIE